ncbi:hypothetical protein GEMRC1_008200 [Eukaryota sp. GEM-RC1]
MTSTFPLRIVSDTEIICIGAFTSLISPTTNVSVVSHNFKLIDSYLASVEGLFSHDCYVIPSELALPLSSQSFLIDYYEGDWSSVVNGFRCCQGSILQCSVTVKHHSYITISFSQFFHFITFSITSRADCEASTRRDPPIEILNFADVTWECFSISNGFELASRCLLTFDSLSVSNSISLVVLENLTIFEIEVYGYDPTRCLQPATPF